VIALLIFGLLAFVVDYLMIWSLREGIAWHQFKANAKGATIVTRQAKPARYWFSIVLLIGQVIAFNLVFLVVLYDLIIGS
jgi:hypothetical protein